MKPKVAFFDFACCEGCQLTVLEMEDELLDILNLVEIVNFREAIDERRDDYDVAFVEGSVTRPADIDRLKRIRENAKVLVALGAGACTGTVNALKNHCEDLEEVRRYVYGEKYKAFDTFAVRPLDAVVDVDYKLHGCPISKAEFKELLTALVNGREWKQKDYPLCVECKRNGNICLYDKGVVCLGPVVRAGCDSICPNNGDKCEGCRGLVDDPNVNAARDVLAEYGYTVEEILGKFRMFNSTSEAAQK